MEFSESSISNTQNDRTAFEAHFYHPLDEGNSEIRLINISRCHLEPNSSLIHCTMEIVSLMDYCDEYRDYNPTEESVGASSRRIVSKWAQKHGRIFSTQSRERDIMANYLPTDEMCRFRWGDYAALSYVWGSQAETSRIIINGSEVSVSQNLATALRELSARNDFSGRFKLWVDAVCINQNDEQERPNQIKKMRQIYSSALSVVAWLGEAGDESDKAFDLLSGLAKFSNDTEQLLELLRGDPEYFGRACFFGLHELMLRPYWSRLWVMQELVMGSSSVILICGDRTLSWVTFCEAITVLYDGNMWMLKDSLLEHDITSGRKHSATIWITKNLHLIFRDVQVLSKLEEQEGGQRLPLRQLLAVARDTKCRDDQDKVYGLVGMMDSTVVERLLQRNITDPGEVFAATAKEFILRFNNLEPLREANPWTRLHTPSWAADWTWRGRLRFTRPEMVLWGPFWKPGSPEPSSETVYSAHGGHSASFRFLSNGKQLECDGFFLDTITCLGGRGKGFFDYGEPETGNEGWKSYYGDDTRKALYSTLLMGRDAYACPVTERHSAVLNLPRNFDDAYRQFSKLGWHWLSNLGGYWWRRERWHRAHDKMLIGDRRLKDYFTDKIPKSSSEYDYTEVYCRVERTMQGRRIMFTEKGFMGWAPDNIWGSSDDQVRLGDLVCIIFGCSTPIIVRPPKTGTYFQVLGEGYVEGCMDGQAMSFLLSGECRVQRFTFC